MLGVVVAGNNEASKHKWAIQHCLQGQFLVQEWHGLKNQGRRLLRNKAQSWLWQTTHMHTHIRTHACTNACMYTGTHTCAYDTCTHMHEHIHTHTYTPACMHECACTHTHTRTQAHTQNLRNPKSLGHSTQTMHVGIKVQNLRKPTCSLILPDSSSVVNLTGC